LALRLFQYTRFIIAVGDLTSNSSSLEPVTRFP
jgi:hypothetical protein